MRTTTHRLDCDKCGQAYDAEAIEPGSDEAQELTPTGDDWPSCPKCGHAYGQPVPAWRNGWDYEQAEEIAAAAKAKGLDPEALTDEQVSEIYEEIEAAETPLYAQVKGMARALERATGVANG